jgi:hypothetical protein
MWRIKQRVFGRIDVDVVVTSPLMRDMALQLDQQIEITLGVLNRTPGPGHFTLVFTGAHGVPAEAVIALPVGHTTWESMVAASDWLQERDRASAFLVSDPWHNARLEAMAADLGFDGHASATWTSAATSEQERGRGYLRETFAYLGYRLFGGG